MKEINLFEENSILEKRLNEIDAMRLSEESEFIEGCVYRITKPTKGKTGRVLVGKIEDVFDDHEIGLEFGAGQYLVIYSSFDKDEKRIDSKSLSYNIGIEYNAKRKQYLIEQGRENEIVSEKIFLGNEKKSIDFNEFFTTEKIAAFGAGVKLLKDLFGTNETVLKLLAKTNEPIPQPDILDSINKVNQLKEVLGSSEKEENEDNMNLLLKCAMEYLPSILNKTGNDFSKVGDVALKEGGSMIKGLLEDDKLCQSFFQEAVKKYGREKAAQLARGFGLNLG